jgi:hypothetical protein
MQSSGFGYGLSEPSSSGLPYRIEMCEGRVRMGEGRAYGQQKGNGRDGAQTNSDESKSRYRTESRAQTNSTEHSSRSTKPKVTGSNPVGRVQEARDCGVFC